MEINLTEVPCPMFSSFAVSFIGNIPQIMAEAVKAGAPCKVSISAMTKTRYSISLQVGENRLAVDWKPEGTKLKLHDTVRKNIWDWNDVQVSYFVASKKQSYPQLLDHVEDIARMFFGRYGVQKLELQVELNKAVRELKAKFQSTVTVNQ